jgi:hypothetical protein
MEGCGDQLKSYFETAWGGTKRKHNKSYHLKGFALLFIASPEGE